MPHQIYDVQLDEDDIHELLESGEVTVQFSDHRSVRLDFPRVGDAEAFARSLIAVIEPVAGDARIALERDVDREVDWTVTLALESIERKARTALRTLDR